MVKPVLYLVLAGCMYAALCDELRPVNLFKPEIGQQTTYYPTVDLMPLHPVTYSIIGKTGDSVRYRIEGETVLEGTFAWSQGKMSAALLASGTLDTNGIFGKVKVFPREFSGGPGIIPYGYTIGIFAESFDTLLVACKYLSSSPYFGNCDFVTTSGFLVRSYVDFCECRNPMYVQSPSVETQLAMGAKLPSSPILGMPSTQNIPLRQPVGAFDLRGRSIQGRVTEHPPSLRIFPLASE